MKNLTSKQLYNACLNNRFLILRYSEDNSTIGVNCGIATFKMFERFKESEQPTKFIGYYPCGFMEYISRKIPFYSKIKT